LGAAAALVSQLDISLAALALNKSVRRWLQLQHPRGLVQPPPPLYPLLPALYLRNENGATWAHAASRSTSEQEQAGCWEEREQQALPCSKHRPGDVPAGFGTERLPRSCSVGWHGWKANQELGLVC